MSMRAFPGAWILAALTLGCVGIAAGQSMDSGGSPSVSASTDSAMGDVSVDSSISMASANSFSSDSGSGNSKKEDKSSSSGAPGASFGVSSAGWSVASSKPGTSGSQPGKATAANDHPGNRQLGKTSSKGSGGSPSGKGGLGASPPKLSSLTSSSAGQQPGVPTALAGTSAGQKSRASKSQEESEPSGGGSSAGGSYTTDFPDSTKDKALLSPPDPTLSPLFVFDPTMNFEFSDLAAREFLSPSIHVGSGSTGTEEKQDVYKRIEERLRSYREGAEKHSKQEKRAAGPGGGNQKTGKPAGTGGLANKSTTSMFSF